MRSLIGAVAVTLALLACPVSAEGGTRLPERTRAAQSAVTVATFNVHQVRKGRSWTSRQNKAAALLRRLDADVVGLQEAGVSPGAPCLAPQCPGKFFPAKMLAKRLGYAVIPMRERKTGALELNWEGHQMLYRPSRLKLDNWGLLGRQGDWAQFTDRKTGRRLVVTVAHFEPGTSTKADRARANSARWLLKRVTDEMARKNVRPAPAVIVGDFNSPARGRNSRAARVFKKAGYANALTLAKDKTNAKLNTYNGFRRRAATSGRHLDQIWVSRGVSVSRWNQAARVRHGKYVGQFASDHNPVAATIQLPPS